MHLPDIYQGMWEEGTRLMYVTMYDRHDSVGGIYLLPIVEGLISMFVVSERRTLWVPQRFSKKVLTAPPLPFAPPEVSLEEIESMQPKTCLLNAAVSTEEVLWQDLSEKEKIIAAALDTFARDDEGRSYYYRPTEVPSSERIEDLYNKVLRAPLKGTHEIHWYAPRIRGA